MFLTAFKLACTQTQRLCDARYRCMRQAMQARLHADPSLLQRILSRAVCCVL